MSNNNFFVVDGRKLTLEEAQDFIEETQWQTEETQKEIESGILDPQKYGNLVTRQMKVIRAMKIQLAAMKKEAGAQ